MREIKFRGYSVEKSEWIYGFFSLHLLKPGGDRVRFITDENTLNMYQVDSVGQFTGSYDYNKKPIYEGDKVKCHLDKYRGEIIGQIEWSKMASQWWITWKNGTSNYKPLEPDYGDEKMYCQYIEVIGVSV